MTFCDFFLLSLERPCASQEGASRVLKKRRRVLKKRWRVLKKTGRLLKKRGRVLKKVCLLRETGGGPLLQKGGVLFKKGGGFLRTPDNPYPLN